MPLSSVNQTAFDDGHLPHAELLKSRRWLYQSIFSAVASSTRGIVFQGRWGLINSVMSWCFS
ncbi:hypothetical protein ACFY2Z_40135 [Streptomyces sp. NPDC001222]|uniref:hypothetical protein n=1 Tax=Streptomyces sp. NPDC001222 TaxID=3364548 RepID=UPI0036BFE102